ncbi:MAG: hypothetical protein LBG91_03840 [Treponema sp.]|jgi:hypothetical protein|nr:hypothetical protein [Treponema sp.]
MKILAINDILRKDVPIYYRRLYTGLASLEFTTKTTNCRIDFSIEFKPTGEKLISVTYADQIDYPLIPLTKELKVFINELDLNGGLPD